MPKKKYYGNIENIEDTKIWPSRAPALQDPWVMGTRLGSFHQISFLNPYSKLLENRSGASWAVSIKVSQVIPYQKSMGNWFEAPGQIPPVSLLNLYRTAAGPQTRGTQGGKSVFFVCSVFPYYFWVLSNISSYFQWFFHTWKDKIPKIQQYSYIFTPYYQKTIENTNKYSKILKIAWKYS